MRRSVAAVIGRIYLHDRWGLMTAGAAAGEPVVRCRLGRPVYTPSIDRLTAKGRPATDVPWQNNLNVDCIGRVDQFQRLGQASWLRTAARRNVDHTNVENRFGRGPRRGLGSRARTLCGLLPGSRTRATRSMVNPAERLCRRFWGVIVFSTMLKPGRYQSRI